MFPATKGLPEPFEDSMEFLGGWTAGSHYVEAHLVVYCDGTSAIVIDPNNTPTSSNITVTRRSDGRYYYPQGGSNSPILVLAHTHQSGPYPSEQDKANCLKTPGLMRAIYHDGTLRGYDENGILWDDQH